MKPSLVLSVKKAREGFFMSRDIPESDDCRSAEFHKVVDAFFASDSLPFSKILSAERIQRVFDKYQCSFGLHGVYTTAIMLWSFLGQVLRDGKGASCQAAVARVVCYCEVEKIDPPTSDTGDYCRARAKLCVEAIHELSCEVAGELEESADEKWLWKGLHPKLADGFTFTLPDTPENQAMYPAPRTQKPGLGFPTVRAVAIISLATAAVTELAMAPYAGKKTGEGALLRSVMGNLNPGDVAVMDRYYCSFMMIALLLLQGTQTCARKNKSRHTDFRRGRRLGSYDHIIVWTRPQRPVWMTEEVYATIPQKLELREIRYHVVERGRRTKVIDVITTLTDAEKFQKEEIAELYGFRWNSELDIRSIKTSLNLNHVRCKSPEMVHREVWTTILGYNLIRTTAAGAALVHGKQPRQLSFTSACQYVLATWMVLSSGLLSRDTMDDICRTMLRQIAECEVANRPGRLEPRVLKRRRHGYEMMKEPRNVLRAELRKHCT